MRASSRGARGARQGVSREGRARPCARPGLGGDDNGEERGAPDDDGDNSSAELAPSRGSAADEIKTMMT